MEYKGFRATEPVFEEDVFHGKIDGIDDCILFEGNTLNKYEQNFHESVDDYIEMCEQYGKPIKQ